MLVTMSWGISVSTVTDYRLGNWGAIPGRGNIFFFSSHPKGTGGPFPGAKALPGCDADYSAQPHAEVKYK
jgi:hypothetical protein